MGRKTYEMIVSFGEWPYGDKPVWVCSSSKVEPMDRYNLQVGKTPEEAYQAAREININHLWLVGGGSLASSFMQKNILTDISLSLIPIILGSGIKLFGALETPVLIKREGQESHDSGFLQIEYTIKTA